MCLFCFKRVCESSNICPQCRTPYDEKNYRYVTVYWISLGSSPSSEKEHKIDDYRHKMKKPAIKQVWPLLCALILEPQFTKCTSCPTKPRVYHWTRQLYCWWKHPQAIQLLWSVRQARQDRCHSPPSERQVLYLFSVYYVREEWGCIGLHQSHWWLLLGRQDASVWSLSWLRLSRASFGTTKYCNYFLRGQECTNTDCLYLHSIGMTLLFRMIH